jgi:hypothetical protein
VSSYAATESSLATRCAYGSSKRSSCTVGK